MFFALNSSRCLYECMYISYRYQVYQVYYIANIGVDVRGGIKLAWCG